ELEKCYVTVPGTVCAVCDKELDDSDGRHSIYDCLEHIKGINTDLRAQLVEMNDRKNEYRRKLRIARSS
ncbi:unnamed protein product, partial [marine sediment metagenome]